ncbi:hypothetical protein [Paraburkholderia sp. BL10I2N1]|uniref:hypothetical protein n=1 Tax=Paraburkholderia sp. BL10I2N1 TaxID=1938796 RepID=UPI0010E962C1|nr:hypothetical protein [Paraburkholderia sp. BL10I2N1]TDN63236.1 hypothetical protein B0G77_6876 [Paraburkholderia sp. BL10I2N1]
MWNLKHVGDDEARIFAVDRHGALSSLLPCHGRRCPTNRHVLRDDGGTCVDLQRSDALAPDNHLSARHQRRIRDRDLASGNLDLVVNVVGVISDYQGPRVDERVVVPDGDHRTILDGHLAVALLANRHGQIPAVDDGARSLYQ